MFLPIGTPGQFFILPIHQRHACRMNHVRVRETVPLFCAQDGDGSITVKELGTAMRALGTFPLVRKFFVHVQYCGELATPLLTVRPVEVYFTPTDHQPSWGCTPPPLYSTCI
jgi:hypothetical protein